MQETDNMGERRRFGLFSSPISTAIGDDGQYKTKIRIAKSIQILATSKESLKLTSGASSPTRPAPASSTKNTFPVLTPSPPAT